jgi:hypothetical protein
MNQTLADERLTVTDVIEYVCLINTTTPNSDHVLIPIDEELEPASVALRGNAAGLL